MKNSKTIIRLLFAIALLAIADFLVFFYYVDAGKSLSKRRTLLSASFDAIKSINVYNEDGSSFSVVRGDMHDWSFGAPLLGVANEQVIMKCLDTFSFVEIEDVMSDGDLLRHGCVRRDYQLDPARLVYEIDCGGSVERILIGSNTPTGSGVYASIAGLNEIYVMPSNFLSAVDLKMDDFRRRAIFDIGIDEVASLEIKSSLGKPLMLMCDDDNPRIKDFLANILSAVAIDFIWPQQKSNVSDESSIALFSSYGLDRDSALNLTLKGLDGSNHQLILGKRASEGRVYALVEGNTVVTVNSSLANLVFNAISELSDNRLFRINPTDINSFTIMKGDVSYVLARADAMSWRLDSPISAPADANFVKTLLDRALTISTSDIVTNGLVVSVSSNLPPAIVTEAMLLGENCLDNLRSREIIGFDRELVRRIVSTDKDGVVKAVVFNRDLKNWNAEDVASRVNVNESAIASILDVICPLTAIRVVKIKATPEELAKFGLEQPVLIISIDSDSDGAVRKNILVGNKSKNERYLTIGSSDAVFTISEAMFKQLSKRLFD